MNTVTEYTLVRPRFFSRRYELRDGETVIGSLEIANLFIRRGIAVLSGGKAWEFRRRGPFSRTYEIFEAGSENLIANCKYQLFFRQSTVVFQTGELLKLQPKFFTTSVDILSDNDMAVIKIKSRHSFKSSYSVEIDNSYKIIEKNPWLPFFGCYIALWRRRQRQSSHH